MYFNKIVTIRYKDTEEFPIQVCITEKKLIRKDGILYISPNTPIAKAIFNHLEGEEVDVATPGGTYRIEISQID